MNNSANVWNTPFIIWLMRITFIVSFFILTATQMLMASDVKGQQMSDTRVTLKLEEENLIIGLKKIEEQTPFRFYYRKAEIKQITDLNLPFSTRTVENTLFELLRNTDVTFRQINNNILLERRQQQNSYLIKGRILGPDHKPVELATVKLSKVSNQSIRFTALADTGGRFSIKAFEKGEYLLKISSIETDSSTQTITIANDPVIQLPDIILRASAIQLKSVSITDKRALIARSIDRLTLNVEGSIYEKGENALGLFNIIPGVNLNGKNLVFRGSESITVYVDNRRVFLSGDQLLSYLRAIPSESIKAYELKAVPGAETDAQNSGVIINIVLKSEYKFGLTGNVSTGYWYNSKDNTKGSTFLNYRAGKFNLQGGLNYSWSPAFYEDKINQQFKSTGVVSHQTERYEERYHNISYNAGVDYKLSPQQTVGISYNMFKNPGSLSAIYATDINYLANAQATAIDSSSHSSRNTTFSYANNMANLYYRNKLDTMGSKLDVGYSYIYYSLEDPSALETRFLSYTGAEMRSRDSLFNKTTGRSKIQVANIDLEKHFTSSLVLNAGGKYTASNTDYSMDFRRGLDELSPLDPLQSNRFLYNEHILAFYSSLAGSLKHWNFKVGLRAEQTNYDGKSVTTGQLIGRNQWNLFPSVFLNKKLGADHSFTLSYNRGIDRPGFRQLNPFVSYTNLYSIWEGNPNLLPYFSDNLQLEYLLKNKYTFTVGFQNTDNGITSNVTNNGDVIISRDENIRDDANVFTSLYIPIKLTKWWEFNTNITLRYRTLDIRGTTTINRSKFTQNVWATSKINLPDKYFLEVSGFYNSNDFFGFYDNFSNGKLDIKLKKNFFQERLTSSLEFQDPFYLYKPKHEINTPDFTRTVMRKRLDFVRYVGIFLTYNFSSGKKQANKENIEAAGNEARRRL